MVATENPAVESARPASERLVQVFHPMGIPSKISPKPMAPRLASLDGKTIYLIDCRFDDAGIFLEQVQGWFADHMPSVKTRLVQLSNVVGREDPTLYAEIKDKADAVIVGVGHCSGCAPAVATHAMTLDSRYQVPAVAFHTQPFAREVNALKKFNGMPGMRYAFVPQPIMGKTPAELRAYVDSTDPTTGRAVMQEVVEGLTRPFGDDEIQKSTFQQTTPRLVDADTQRNLHELFLQNQWTDTLPIVLPTRERVEAMLAGTSHKPDEIVGQMRPNSHRELWQYTVEKVAVNAVMAGARPAYFPVILALASTGISARGTSTSSASSMVVVNGPIRDEIGMNSGIGAMGPYNHANSTIGRAYGLLSQNLCGGSIAGLNYQGSQGNAYQFTSLTVAENEERSPWEPFHVEHGFARDQSTVSVFGFCWHTAFTLGVREKHWREHVTRMLQGMDARSRILFVLDPIAARQFVERGPFESKASFLDWAYETAKIPAEEYWDYQLIQNYVYPQATFGEEPYASRLKAAPTDLVNMFRRDQFGVVVVGGETNGYWRIISAEHNKTVSVDEWR